MNHLDLQSQFRVLDRKMDLLFNFLLENHDSKANGSETGELAKINHGLTYESDLVVANGDVPSLTHRTNGETATFIQECSNSVNSSQPENIKINHKNPKKKNTYECHICKKSFNFPSNLKRHVITHTTKHEPKSTKPTSSKQLKKKAIGQKSLVKCDICDKYLKHENMKSHSKIHTGEKPFSCIFCNQSFRQLNILKNHLLRHTGEKPFKCSICGKYFRQKGQFKIHMKIHSTFS